MFKKSKTHCNEIFLSKLLKWLRLCKRFIRVKRMNKKYFLIKLFQIMTFFIFQQKNNLNSKQITWLKQIIQLFLI